ncbi:PREDICTED: protein O-mannose kinase-like [Branchiostoma belcheri]|uniref:Protein O-mannose kinase n=1 Tax=Branchiostoma belcheri TaxID=7741 RepID=A0A6P4ZPT2_BRABE|nr:PREDICTED: protein O-mannose kinase-like [Branchiostoma belcheri]
MLILLQTCYRSELADIVTMRRVRERDVVCLLLLTLLILYLLMWFWFGSLQPASSVFLNYEVDKMLGQERQGKVKESRSNLDVVTVAGLGQRRLCPLGSFRLSKMETCMPWLGCKEITNEVTIKLNIGSGTVKKVYKAVWRNHTVAYSRLKNTTYFEDFSEGIEMLKTLQHPSVLQFVGSCNTTLLTEFYKFGSANFFIKKVLKLYSYRKFDNVRTRFNMALSYLEAIHSLHNSPVGTRVMCDSNSVHKSLTQFLVTQDFKLVLSDLDATPEVNHEANLFIKCGSRRIVSDFVAPEQLWPFENETFDDSRMPSYDEKTDIWKIPGVVDYLLGKVNGSEVIRLHLFKVHQQCHNRDPRQRPTTKVLLEEYNRVKNMFFPEHIT